MKLIDQIFEVCAPQLSLCDLRFFGPKANLYRLRQLLKIEDPNEIERLYHEEQAIAAGEYFWLWIKYILKKVQERDTKINNGHIDEVPPLDEFVRGLNAPPVILCEVFFRCDWHGKTRSDILNDYNTMKYPSPYNDMKDIIYAHFGATFHGSGDFHPFYPYGLSPTVNECTFEDYKRWFSTGVMQFVRTIWTYEKPNSLGMFPDYEFIKAFQDRIPELCQVMIEELNKGNLSPARFSFGFLSMMKYQNFFSKIQEQDLFEKFPARLLRLYTDTGPLDGKAWGDFCCIHPSHIQQQMLKKDFSLEQYCAKCPFPCRDVHIPYDYGYEDELFWWLIGPDFLYEIDIDDITVDNGFLDRWHIHEDYQDSCRWENFGYIKFEYISQKASKYIPLHHNGVFSREYESNGKLYHKEYTFVNDFIQGAVEEEEERLYYPEYYHPKKRFGKRHRGKSSSGHQTKKTVLNLPTLEQRVQVSFKKWDKILEPIVQTVAFLTNHGLNAQGHDLSTWQNASNWLFEINEKRLAEWVTNLSTQQTIKLMQLCGPLSWQKLHELLAEPIKQCKGECIAPFKELIQGKIEQPLSESAQSMIQNEVFAQVYRLAIAWSKIC